MSLSNALQSSVSGLDTTSTAISVIGDNIANVNTTGFKERRAEFSDVLGQTITSVGGFSSVGAGAKLSKVSTIFGQGTFENTGRNEDLAIQGSGFFVLEGQQGRAYSRAGIFTLDTGGTLVNSIGQRVQGFAIDPATGLSNGQLGDITLSTAVSPPSPTSLANLSLSLDSNSDDTLVFDITDPNATSAYSTGFTVYDSLGNGHLATLFFNYQGPGGGGPTWNYTVTMDQADTTIPPVPGATDVVQGTGTLSFDSNGLLTAGNTNSLTFEFSGGATAGQVIDLDFGPLGGTQTTSLSLPSNLDSFSQDGFAAGTLQFISVDAEGFVNGTFSNGETTALAQVALATFPNVEGLSAIGDNNLLETRASGQALVGSPGSGSYGSIRSGSLEQSTVDLAAQFVKLIVNQRAFQANTRTVSVTNELMANLVSLGQ